MTSSARTTTILSLLAGALVLGLLLWASQPRTEGELDQLRRATAQAEQALHLARLGCELQPEPADRAQCHLAIDGAELPLKIARGVLTTAEACALADGSCQETQLARARELLPEVRRLTETLLPAPVASTSASASASTTPEPPEVPPPASASAPVGPPRPGEGGQ